MARRLSGSIVFSLGSGLAALLLRWGLNPWFMDAPLSYALVTLIPLIVLGWVLGPFLPELPRPRRWFAASAVLFALACWPPGPGGARTGLVVVGLDGASFGQMTGASLPVFESLQAEGKSGILVAEPPLVADLLWPRMMHVEGETSLWEEARAQGLETRLWGWPGQEEPELLSPAEAALRIGEGIRWSTLWSATRFSAMETLSPLPERKRVAYLLRATVLQQRDRFVAMLHRDQPDVAVWIWPLPHALARTHWSHDGGRYVQGALRLADRVLGELTTALTADAHFMVLSAHGFTNTDDAQAAVPQVNAVASFLTAHIGAVSVVPVGHHLVIDPDGMVDDAALEAAVASLVLPDGRPLFAVSAFPRHRGWRLRVANSPPISEWVDQRVGGHPVGHWLQAGLTDKGIPHADGMVIWTGPGVSTGELGRVGHDDVSPTLSGILGLPKAENSRGSAWDR
jgi:hypothetical protein